jgi:hypothetical protein
LPTVIYPNKLEGSINPVTLTTIKHQELMSYLRPNFEGKVASGGKEFDRLNLPDSVGPPERICPSYRAEPIQIHKMLENVRPSICYVFGAKSPVSVPQLRKDKMALTGSGVCGSGGVKEGRVKEILLEGHGHLIPQEAPSLCANATAAWIES